MRVYLQLAFGFAFLLILVTALAAAPKQPIPPAKVDVPRARESGREKAVFAGGCFCNLKAVFERVKGVVKTTVGIPAVQQRLQLTIRCSPKQQAMPNQWKWFTTLRSSPTVSSFASFFGGPRSDGIEPAEQGPDVGTLDRSAIFYSNDEQKRIAAAYIAQLDEAKVFPKRIVTDLSPLQGFYRAEGYHQDFALKNPTNSYIQVCDLPKIAALKQQFPELFVDYKRNKSYSERKTTEERRDDHFENGE